jgi:hypothetical protein
VHHQHNNIGGKIAAGIKDTNTSKQFSTGSMTPAAKFVEIFTSQGASPASTTQTPMQICHRYQ